MKPQLSQQEIEMLFTFVQSKNVPYRDIQFEIVDHLASAIEDMKEEDPKLTYDNSLKEIYKRFPITGFAQLQQQKEDALKKYWRKKMIPYIQDYFKLPKIILTLLAFFLVRQTVTLLGQIDFSMLKPIFEYNPFTAILYIIIGTQLLRKKRWKKENPTTDEYLFIKGFETSSRFIFFPLLLISILSIRIMIEGYNVNFEGINSYLLTAIILFTFLNYYLKNHVFNDLLRHEAERRYGHLELSDSAIDKAKYFYKYGLDATE